MIAADVKYKKTGINWMPEVPEHWDIVRLKNVSKIVSGATPKSSVSANWDGNINWVTPAEFGDEMYIGESVRKITKTGLQSCAASLVPIGSIILSNRAPIGSLGISKVELSTNQGCKSIIPTHINNYFLYFLMTLQKENLNVLGNGTTFRELATPSLRNYKIPFPPREEQDKIASHLYFENEKITNFIKTKQRFIELLKEQRQSIITNAVTKGTDEKAKMKESGIDWIGKLPEHWEVRRFKNVCVLQRGHDLPKEQFKEGEFPVFGSNGIIGYHKEFTTKAPCITIGRSGSVGEINFIEKDFWAHNTCLFVKENYKNEWEYLYFLISSIDIKMVSNGSAVPTLDRNNVHSLRVSYPPTIEEQKQIVEHIKSETKTLDIAISKAEREIELIKEYREAMIAEAVTGKMKL